MKATEETELLKKKKKKGFRIQLKRVENFCWGCELIGKGKRGTSAGRSFRYDKITMCNY